MSCAYIYKLTSLSTDAVFIGRTTKTLKDCLSKHYRNYKQYLKGKHRYSTSFEIVKHGDAEIHLLEEVVLDNDDSNALQRALAIAKVMHRYP